MRAAREGCADSAQIRALVAFAVFLLFAGVLPLLGAASAGRSIAPYLEFPPTTAATPATPFNAVAVLVVALAIAATLAPFAWRWWRTPRARATQTFPIPWWGWAGVLLLTASWAIAWTRLPVFADVQRYSFTPVWLGYILAINALTFRRSGSCLLCERPLFLAALFPLSAAFWWYFEYLNRFVRNWHYEGVETLSATQYVIEASIPFATVLPAVVSTTQWLATFPRAQQAFDEGFRIAGAARLTTTLGAFALGALGLFAIGRWPQVTFPLVWLAPIGMLFALQRFAGRQRLGAALERGDWRPVVLPAFAALICGFFWELWNYGSLARWVYTVPYVGGARLFEMPLLGYAGYLPFGLACAAVADLFDTRCDAGENGVESRDRVRPTTRHAARSQIPFPSPSIEVSHETNDNVTSADRPRDRRDSN